QAEPFNFSEMLSINATLPPPACPFGDFNNTAGQSEDCLHLSVRSRDLAGRQPVLILLASQEVGVELGDVFSAIHGVVLATVQSRQGVLGYLSFDGVPDNLGLRDQLLAIQFLEEAVGSFGGDAARVSLAGHGNAAAAAGLLAVADGSDGSLFQRVAMLGGSIASPLAWSDSPDEAQKLGWQLANQLACNLSSPEESLNCLVAVSVEQLLLAAASVSPDGFVPLGSGEMFPNGSGGPLDLWRQGSNFSVLTGAAVNSGGPRADAALEGGQWPDVTESVFNQIVSQEFLHFPRVHTQTSPCGQNFLRLSLADWPTKKFGEAVRPLLAQAIGDFRYACPVWEAAGDLLQAPSTEPVYVYQMNVTDPIDSRGDHSVDVRYFLGEPLVRAGYPAGHESLASTMMDHLGRFFMNYRAANDSSSADSLPDGFGLEPGRCPMWKHEMPFHNRLCGPDAGLLTAQFDNSMAAEPKQAQEVPESNRVRRVDYLVLRNYSITVVGYGSVLGETIRTEAGTTLTQFLGVPYAEPPVGELRFANPKPLSGTNNRILALSMPPPCMQRDEFVSSMSEDCLYLNIWTPVHSDLSEDDLPVIVFLHGGFFQFGAVSDWRGHRVLDSAKLLLVTVAYRVGAFGFLSLDNSTVSGNFGLRDQEEALKWIRYNIEKFGGSRTKVTLMGVEAGAASIGYHLARSPVLFQRAVLLTGSPYMPYPVSNDTASVRLINRVFAQNVLNCGSDDIPACLAGLRALNATFINERQRDFNRLYTGIEFPPVIDGDFIRSDPLAMGGADLASVPLLELLEVIAHFPRFPTEPRSDIKTALVLHFTDYFSRDNYTRDERALANAISNRMFTCSNQLFLGAVSAENSRAVYKFRFEEPFRSIGTSLPEATLFHDASYAFGFPTASAEAQSPERANLSRVLIRSLANFASSGVPSWPPTGWPRYKPDAPVSLVMRAEQQQLATDIFMDRECNFWDRVLPNVGKRFPPPETTPGTTMEPTMETTMETDGGNYVGSNNCNNSRWNN
uniref:COesterase domain-containing protein n=1 Tax=Macrostomum lignano TaxID=282301 RepID=A0A1I8I8B3_9PLAT